MAEKPHVVEHDEQPNDALELWELQDRMLSDLFDKWKQDTDRLRQGDSVQVRWERGSAVKLILQHLAVREAAIQATETVLERRGCAELAANVDRSGVERREQIAQLDRLVRGKVGMNTNTPEGDVAIEALAERFEREMSEDSALIQSIDDQLGPEGREDLPSARYVRTHSPTYTSPTPRWHDRIGPLKAMRALYDHLRGSPSGVREPGLSGSREQTPGLRAKKSGMRIEKRNEG